MDRNAILDQIVASASEELRGLDGEVENELTKSASEIPYAPHTTDLEEVVNNGGQGGLLSKVAEEQNKVISPSETDVVNVIKSNAEELMKTANYEGDEMDGVLEKIAMDAGNELIELEKTAEAFGHMVADVFLRDLGF